MSSYFSVSFSNPFRHLSRRNKVLSFSFPKAESPSLPTGRRQVLCEFLIQIQSKSLPLIMAVKVKRDEKKALFFVTFTCFKWLPLFEKTQLYDNIYKWFAYLESDDIKTSGYVIMPNHLHCLLYLPANAKDLNIVIGNGKRLRNAARWPMK